MKDKEKQLNVSTKEEIKARNKTGKEKDELKQALLHYATAEATNGIKTLIDCEGCAFYLYEMLGYRKITDSVVLSKEEYEEMVADVKLSKEKLANMLNQMEKETAEKSINDIFKVCKQRFTDTKGYTCWGDIEIEIQQYAEQVGVEIKD